MSYHPATRPVRLYFDNCPTCPNGCFETARTEIGEMITLCRERWGEGRLVRINGEFVWTKNSDTDGDWRGCCAEKIAGTRPPRP